MWEILFWLFVSFLFIRWIYSGLEKPRVIPRPLHGSVLEKPFEIKVSRAKEDTPKSHWERLDTPLKRKTTIDENGYKRNGYGRLIHRDKAEKLIYNKGDYSLEFCEYVVHHKDGNKLNNLKDNLEILTREEHRAKHGIS